MEIINLDNKQKVVELMRKYKIEILFIFLSFTGVLVSFYTFHKVNNRSNTQEIIIEENGKSEDNYHEEDLAPERIFIDISGSVLLPGVYELGQNARLEDVLKLAQGLSADADYDYFYRNYNQSRILVDQEKIYVPSKYETRNGIFIEGVFTVDQNTPHVQQKVVSTATQISDQSTAVSDKIRINYALEKELDTLPGVGPVTAQHIIDNRPYGHIDDLLIKDAVNTGVFEKIKDLITIE